jgi:signal transduction histidine kinase
LIYSVNLFAEAGSQQVKQGNQERVHHHLMLISETAQQALKEMRLLIFELRPPILETDGLAGALSQRLDSVERRAGVDAHLLVENVTGLGATLEEGLYRIAQEALNNALKHARASRVEIRIRAEQDWVILEILDNGAGFATIPAGKSGGMGWANMRERAERLGGTLQVESTPGQGTRVTAKVPRALDVNSAVSDGSLFSERMP